MTVPIRVLQWVPPPGPANPGTADHCSGVPQSVSTSLSHCTAVNGWNYFMRGNCTYNASTGTAADASGDLMLYADAQCSGYAQTLMPAAATAACSAGHGRYYKVVCGGRDDAAGDPGDQHGRARSRTLLMDVLVPVGLVALLVATLSFRHYRQIMKMGDYRRHVNISVEDEYDEEDGEEYAEEEDGAESEV